MSKKNAINNETQELTIDPGASGDSFIQLNINTIGEFRIGVDDTDDSFRISQGSALGTNDTFVMTASGERTMPLQSAVTAYQVSTVISVTGDGTEYTMLWDTDFFDQNGDFNNGTGTFTAPVTGLYRVSLAVWINDADNAAYDTFILKIITSNRTYKGGVCNAFLRVAQEGSSGQGTNVTSVLADMDASDTLTTTVIVSGGAKGVDFGSVSAAAPRGCLSISLVC